MSLDKVEMAHREQLDVEDASPEHEKELTIVDTAYTGNDMAAEFQNSPLERRLKLKTDAIVVPIAALIYFVAYLDRNSIGNAKIMGLTTGLSLSSQQYYNCVTMFYVGYVIFMLPGNILLRIFSPHKLIGGCVVTFGTLVACLSAINNYESLLALRILVGFSQAFIQGIGLYVSMWYQRDELASRGAAYYSAATLAGAFSGLIAFGVQTNLTTNATGRDPWRWLFIIEGVMAIGVGILTWLVLPRFPDRIRTGKNWIFTNEEVQLAIARSQGYNTTGARFELYQIWVALKDPKSWAFAFINGGVALTISSVGVFLPTFIVAFGFTAERAQLFSVIPYAFAFVMLIIVCYTSDYLNVKGPALLCCLCVVAVGYIILLNASDVLPKMIATCLITSGVYPGVILLVSWLGINTGGFTKRGTTWAMAEIVGQSFSIMGSNIYTDGPRYIKGHSIVLGFIVFALCNVAGLMIYLRYLNKKKDRIVQEYATRNETHPHTSKSLEEEYDFHINFRYIV